MTLPSLSTRRRAVRAVAAGAFLAAISSCLSPVVAQEREVRPRRNEVREDRARPEGPRRAARGARAELRRARVQEGEMAPAFALPLLEGSLPPTGVRLDEGKRVSLAAFRGKPVVLIFGSYT